MNEEAVLNGLKEFLLEERERSVASVPGAMTGVASSDGPNKEQQEQFRAMFKPGNFWVVIGPRGSAKTTLMSSVMSAVAKWYPDYHIMTNILLKKRIVLEDGTETFIEYYPTRIHKVESISDVFHLLPGILVKKQKVILIIDEAMLATGFQAGTTVLSQDVRAMTGFASIIRKVGIAVGLISQSERLIMARYRDAGFITGFIRRRYGLEEGYKIQEVAEVIGPRGFEIKNDRLIVYPEYTFVLRTEPIGFGKPSVVAEVGDVVFDTSAPAQFRMGLYRKTGQKFNLTAAIDALSVIEEQAVAALRDHLENPPKKERVQKPDSRIPEVPTEEIGEDPETVPNEPASTAPKGTAEEIRTRLQAGEGPSAIARDLGVSKGTISDIKRRMLDAGELSG